jgi:hypothetical protein
MSEMVENVGDLVAMREDREMVENPVNGCFGLGAGGCQGEEIVKITGLGSVPLK